MKGRKTGGRTKGTPNKKSQQVRDMLDALGCNPIELLAETAMGKPLLARLPLTPEHTEPTLVHPTADQIIGARSKLAEFYAPKLKAIEHSGSIGSHEADLEELDDVSDA